MTLIELSKSVSPYYKQGQNTNVRQMNVVGAFSDNRTLEVMFGGAYSGTYSI